MIWYCALIKNDPILIILKAHSLVILIIVKVLNMDRVLLKFEFVEVLVSSRIRYSLLISGAYCVE